VDRNAEDLGCGLHATSQNLTGDVDLKGHNDPIPRTRRVPWVGTHIPAIGFLEDLT
jgi:hypothetical protein